MRDYIADINPLAIFYDGLDEAIIGIDSRESRVIYDRDLIIELLCVDMTLEEAEEYFDYNIASLYCGEYTPIIIEKFNDKEKDN